MLALILALLLIAILFGAGSAVHLLWIVAVVAAILWLVGFAVRPASGGGRWYYW